MHKKHRDSMFIITSLAPAVLCFLVFFIYPLIKTSLMSFFEVPVLSSPYSEWSFMGLSNFSGALNNPVFQSSLHNLWRIWLYGGIATLTLALFFAVIIASGVKGKKFWRSLVYLPNTINAIALGNMWVQYIFQPKYGMFKTLFTNLGWTSLAKINWLGPNMIFWSMLWSFVLGSVGYFMLIFLAGIEQIPQDIYESARIDGANVWVQFWKLTFPLIRDVFRTGLTLWTMTSVGFFTWGRMFTTMGIATTTVTPVNYLYNDLFGKGAAMGSAGEASAIGVMMAVIVLIVHVVINKVLREEALEY